MKDQDTLIEIPLVTLEDGIWDLTDHEMRKRTLDLLSEGRKMIGGPGLKLMDRLSHKWAAKTDNPHFQDVVELSKDLPIGLWFMNFCYEWGCTTRVGTHPDTNEPLLCRTLDWPFVGIGRNLTVAHHKDQADNQFYNLSWPGYTGVITAMAPGRFAIAINQAPMRKRTPSKILNWMLARPGIWRSNALPPAHLLRQVFDQCPDYKTAVKTLCETPLALPVIYSIAGVNPGETCIIERKENEYNLIEGNNASGNHWQSYNDVVTPRGENSFDRRDQLNRTDWQDMNDFRWVQEPVLNVDTRLAVETSAASGKLHVRGYESDGAATRDFIL